MSVELFFTVCGNTRCTEYLKVLGVEERDGRQMKILLADQLVGTCKVCRRPLSKHTQDYFRDCKMEEASPRGAERGDAHLAFCPMPGGAGHVSCGWCPEHDVPRTRCKCRLDKPIEGEWWEVFTKKERKPRVVQLLLDLREPEPA